MQNLKSDFQDITIDGEDITCIRQRISYYLMDQDYENAVFWSEKVYLLTNENMDLYYMLQSLTSARRFRHVLHYIDVKFAQAQFCSKVDDPISKAPLWIRYFAAKCHSNIGQCARALELLHDIVPTVSAEKLKNDTLLKSSLTFKGFYLVVQFIRLENSSMDFVDEDLLIASAARLKGTILEYTSDNSSASYFVTSLTKDTLHYSSARKLFENKMMSPTETKTFINEYYHVIESSNDTFSKIALAFYLISSGLHSPFVQETAYSPSVAHSESRSGENKDSWPENIKRLVELVIRRFENSLDVMRWKADYYVSADFSTASLNLTQEIISRTNVDDPFACVLHALTLFKACKMIDLKVLADTMAADANVSITKQITYRVVCSIRDLGIGKATESQNNLRVAVKLSAVAALRGSPWLISQATLWMILGHAAWLAGDKEHALASFNSAADISPGNYITWFFIGALHAETDELSLALTYYLKAHRIALKHLTGVPLYMINEIGCTIAKKGNYQMAIKVLLNSVGEAIVDESRLLDHIIRKDQSKVYKTILHNLSYCFFKAKLMQESFRFAQLASGIDRSTLANQKLLAFLLDYVGKYKDAQFIYQTIILGTSKLREFKKTYTVVSARDPNPNDILPPPANPTSQIKEYDYFCTRMIERSLFMERYARKNRIDYSNNSISPNNQDDNHGSVGCLPNTSLSFDNDRTTN